MYSFVELTNFNTDINKLYKSLKQSTRWQSNKYIEEEYVIKLNNYINALKNKEFKINTERCGYYEPLNIYINYGRLVDDFKVHSRYTNKFYEWFTNCSVNHPNIIFEVFYFNYLECDYIIIMNQDNLCYQSYVLIMPKIEHNTVLQMSENDLINSMNKMINTAVIIN